jgi:uncharacterized protein (DUF302 family)
MSQDAAHEDILQEGNRSEGREPVNTTTSPGELTTKASPLGVRETVDRLTELVAARGMTLFAVIDQAAEAHRVGLHLRPTTLVMFGNPVAGTAVMDAAPEAAIDLPLKVLIWADGPQTKVTYLSPGALAARHRLDPELAANLAGIDPLTEALVSG